MDLGSLLPGGGPTLLNLLRSTSSDSTISMASVGSFASVDSNYKNSSNDSSRLIQFCNVKNNLAGMTQVPMRTVSNLGGRTLINSCVPAQGGFQGVWAVSGGSMMPVQFVKPQQNNSFRVQQLPVQTSLGNNLQPVQVVQIPPGGFSLAFSRGPASIQLEQEKSNVSLGKPQVKRRRSVDELDDILPGSLPKRRRRPKAKDSTSKYRGVSWHKRDQRWIARIWIQGRVRHLGNFRSEHRAAVAVDEKLLQVYGQDAELELNIPSSLDRERIKLGLDLPQPEEKGGQNLSS